MKYLTSQQINNLYEEFSTPEHVKRHCLAVTNTALAIGKALNDTGLNLDLKLLYCAGMTHDTARVLPDHGVVIANRLDELDYHEIADIVRVHMRYKGFDDLTKINETDILCLADCTVKEDSYVGIEERIEYLINKHGSTDQIRERFENSKKQAIRFIQKIESIVNKSLDEIVLGDLNDR